MQAESEVKLKACRVKIDGLEAQLIREGTGIHWSTFDLSDGLEVLRLVGRLPLGDGRFCVERQVFGG